MVSVSFTMSPSLNSGYFSKFNDEPPCESIKSRIVSLPIVEDVTTGIYSIILLYNYIIII